MKAIILAAGLGTRMGDVSKILPKCLINIKGKTLLEHQIELLASFGIKEVYVVIGDKGDCWSEENKNKIKELAKNIVVNTKNVETKNTYSLQLGLGAMESDDVVIVDGDLFFTKNLIDEIVRRDENLILSRHSYKNDEKRKKIIIDEHEKVLEMSKDFDSRMSIPYKIYGACISVRKKYFELFKKIVSQEKYHAVDLSPVLNEFFRNMEFKLVMDDRWVNINTIEDVAKAETLDEKKFVVLMYGYTATGKSTVARKISTIPNIDIFHSAVVRKELDLAPKTKEDADKLFDYRNNLREQMDRKVYGELARRAAVSLASEKNVVLDAFFPYHWQRKLVYDAVRQLNPEIFIVKVVCHDENEVKRRIDERGKQFGNSPLHETPSWNSYISSKGVTEPLEKDFSEKELLHVLQYDSMTKEVKVIVDLSSLYLNSIIQTILK